MYIKYMMYINSTETLCQKKFYFFQLESSHCIAHLFNKIIDFVTSSYAITIFYSFHLNPWSWPNGNGMNKAQFSWKQNFLTEKSILLGIKKKAWEKERKYLYLLFQCFRNSYFYVQIKSSDYCDGVCVKLKDLNSYFNSYSTTFSIQYFLV